MVRTRVQRSRIRGHLPALIINGEEIDFENGPKWSNFRLSWAPDLDLDLGSGHAHYLFSSLIEYYLYTKFHGNRKNFLWTDGHTDGRKFATHGIRSTSKVWKLT